MQSKEEKRKLLTKTKSVVNNIGRDLMVIDFKNQKNKMVIPRPEFDIKQPSAYQHSSLFGHNKVKNDVQRQFLTAKPS